MGQTVEQAGKQKFSTCRLSGSCEGSFEWKVGGPLKRQLRRHMGNCVTIVCYMISIIKWATAANVAGCTCNQNAYENKQQQRQQEMSMIIGHLLNCRSLDKCLVYCDAPGPQPQYTHKYRHTHVAHATHLRLPLPLHFTCLS